MRTLEKLRLDSGNFEKEIKRVRRFDGSTVRREKSSIVRSFDRWIARSFESLIVRTLDRFFRASFIEIKGIE